MRRPAVLVIVLAGVVLGAGCGSSGLGFSHTVRIKVSGDTPPEATRSSDVKLGPTPPRVGI